MILWWCCRPSHQHDVCPCPGFTATDILMFLHPELTVNLPQPCCRRGPNSGKGYLDIVRSLLNATCDVGRADRYGHNALFSAAMNGMLGAKFSCSVFVFFELLLRHSSLWFGGLCLFLLVWTRLVGLVVVCRASSNESWCFWVKSS